MPRKARERGSIRPHNPAKKIYWVFLGSLGRTPFRCPWLLCLDTAASVGTQRIARQFLLGTASMAGSNLRLRCAARMLRGNSLRAAAGHRPPYHRIGCYGKQSNDSDDRSG